MASNSGDHRCCCDYLMQLSEAASFNTAKPSKCSSQQWRNILQHSQTFKMFLSTMAQRLTTQPNLQNVPPNNGATSYNTAKPSKCSSQQWRNVLQHSQTFKMFLPTMAQRLTTQPNLQNVPLNNGATSYNTAKSSKCSSQQWRNVLQHSQTFKIFLPTMAQRLTTQPNLQNVPLNNGATSYNTAKSSKCSSQQWRNVLQHSQTFKIFLPTMAQRLTTQPNLQNVPPNNGATSYNTAKPSKCSSQQWRNVLQHSQIFKMFLSTMAQRLTTQPNLQNVPPNNGATSYNTAKPSKCSSQQWRNVLQHSQTFKMFLSTMAQRLTTQPNLQNVPPNNGATSYNTAKPSKCSSQQWRNVLQHSQTFKMFLPTMAQRLTTQPNLQNVPLNNGATSYNTAKSSKCSSQQWRNVLQHSQIFKIFLPTMAQRLTTQPNLQNVPLNNGATSYNTAKSSKCSSQQWRNVLQHSQTFKIFLPTMAQRLTTQPNLQNVPPNNGATSYNTAKPSKCSSQQWRNVLQHSQTFKMFLSTMAQRLTTQPNLQNVPPNNGATSYNTTKPSKCSSQQWRNVLQHSQTFKMFLPTMAQRLTTQPNLQNVPLNNGATSYNTAKPSKCSSQQWRNVLQHSQTFKMFLPTMAQRLTTQPNLQNVPPNNGAFLLPHQGHSLLE